MITRPIINGSILAWSGFRAYKTMVDADDEYRYTRSQLSEVIKEAKANKAWAEKAVKKLKLPTYGTEMERVEAILECVRHRMKYNKTQPYVAPAISSRSGNCAAYSDMFYILCKAAGYPVRFVIGYYGDICHAWNKVKIGSAWYWVDAAWYDSDDGMSYGFSKKLWKTHSKVFEVW